MTIRRKIVILHMVILTFSCKQNQVIVKYDNESRYEDIDKTMIADKSKESVTVFLESYFNGFVKGYIRDELIFKKASSVCPSACISTKIIKALNDRLKINICRRNFFIIKIGNK